MNGVGLPGTPMVISTLPSSVHLRTQYGYGKRYERPTRRLAVIR